MLRTVTELKELVKNRNIDQFLNTAREAFASTNFRVEDAIMKYKEKYPENYVEYIGIENGEPVFPGDHYEQDDEGNIVLKPEYKELVEKGMVRPSLELFLNEEVERQLEKAQLSNPEFMNFIRPYFLELVQNLADYTHRRAREILADKEDLTQEQIERYLAKYETAKAAKEGNELALETMEAAAAIEGMSRDDLIALIIYLGENWQEKLRQFYVLIDVFRVGVNRLFTRNPMDAINAVKEARNLGTDTTPETLKEVFSKYIK